MTQNKFYKWIIKRKKKLINYSKWLAKAISAATLAFIILNITCYFYYYIPYNVECTSKATDFQLPSHFKGYNMAEGFAKVSIDSKGYNNEDDFDDIEYLCMGSSHTLAYNVDAGKGYPALLNTLLKDSNKGNAYNIGMFGHEWKYCIDNLSDALEEFKPKKAVIIEIFSTKQELGSLKTINEGNELYAGSITSDKVQLIKQLPYMQLSLHQLKDMMADHQVASYLPSESGENDIPTEYTNELEKVIKKASETASSYNCQLYFIYNVDIKVNNNGQAYPNDDAKYKNVFVEFCQKHGITFIDMSETFLQRYEQDKILPRGFENTKIGEGHLNVEGHQMIANVLYTTLTQGE